MVQMEALPNVIQDICWDHSSHSTDLFVSRLSSQLTTLVSWRPDLLHRCIYSELKPPSSEAVASKQLLIGGFNYKPANSKLQILYKHHVDVIQVFTYLNAF